MLRSRSFTVLSFMSQWGGPNLLQKQPPSNTASPGPASPALPSPSKQASATSFAQSATALDTFNNERPSPSPANHARSESRQSFQSSRPMSMIQTYQPPVMEVGQDTLPELQRIFTFLNSHSNKLYQEGYFLKFHDTDGRKSYTPRRAQLVTLTACRWPPRARSKVAGVFCPARRHDLVAVGC
jgi:CCR4-NOT transcriptional complex subunit CAF120